MVSPYKLLSFLKPKYNIETLKVLRMYLVHLTYILSLSHHMDLTTIWDFTHIARKMIHMSDV